jgi:hypothetical protein
MPYPSQTKYSLNPSEQRIAQWIAKQRHAVNRKGNVVNQRIGPQSDAWVDLQGFAGELAFCALFNVYPDFSLEPRAGSHDCIWSGWRIDVKTTDRESGRLLIAPTKTGTTDVDLFALMIGEFPTYRYVGCFESRNALVPARLGDVGRGPTYVVERSDLVPPPGYPTVELRASEVRWS